MLMNSMIVQYYSLNSTHLLYMLTFQPDSNAHKVDILNLYYFKVNVYLLIFHYGNVCF